MRERGSNETPKVPPREKLAGKGGILPTAVWLRKMNQMFGHKNASMPGAK